MTEKIEIWSEMIFPKDQRKDLDRLDLSVTVFKSDGVEIEILKLPFTTYLKCLAALESAEKQIERILAFNSASESTLSQKLQ